MKEYEIISKYRKAKKGNFKAEIELMIWYKEFNDALYWIASRILED